MDTKEEWRDVVGFEGKYRVSSHGRVWSNKRKKYLKPFPNKDGYLLVDLGSHTYTVHKLVVLSFMGEIPKWLEINHKDENKQNNRVSNLEICTRQYNVEYSKARQSFNDVLAGRKQHHQGWTIRRKLKQE